MTIIKNHKSVNESKSKLNKIFDMIKLLGQETNTIYENTISKKAISNNIKDLVNEDTSYFDKLNDIPYFSPEELEDFKNLYSKSKIRYFDEDHTMSSIKWIDNCSLIYNGIIPDDYNDYTGLWISTIERLFFEMKKTNDINRINEIKQNILDLNWNPEIEFTLENRIKITQNRREMIKSKLYKEIYDIEELLPTNVDSYNESAEMVNENKCPLYVVLSYTGTGFGKIINKYTHGIYSHAALSLDSDLTRLYSFNLVDNGFTLESINSYNKRNKEAIMAVYTFFISKEDLLKVKTKLDYFLLNKNKTKYSLLNILGLLVNKPVELANNMICSQFVDYILKYIDIDITKKHSGLVTPNDLYISLNPTIFKLYEGKIIDYDYKKVKKLIDDLISKNTTITESMYQITNENEYLEQIYLNKDSITNILALDEKCDILSEENMEVYKQLKPYIDIYYLQESKEFPIQFDDEGNLLIKRMRMLDFNEEFSRSHKLLKLYEESNNIEGMKYELSKLWFLNIILEKRIYSESNKNKVEDYHKSRARILNDFNKYSRIVNSQDETFNFTEYYNNSPFSDVTIKINNSTLHHGGKLVKNISKLFLH